MPFSFRRGEAGKIEAKERHEAIGTLILPAEATEIPAGTQDCFTSEHCGNGLMDSFFSLLFKSQEEYTVLYTHSLTYLTTWSWCTRSY